MLGGFVRPRLTGPGQPGQRQIEAARGDGRAGDRAGCSGSGRPGATAHRAVRRSPRPIASRPRPRRRHRGQGGRPGTHRCGLPGPAQAAGAAGPRGARRPSPAGPEPDGPGRQPGPRRFTPGPGTQPATPDRGLRTPSHGSASLTSRSGQKPPISAGPGAEERWALVAEGDSPPLRQCVGTPPWCYPSLPRYQAQGGLPGPATHPDTSVGRA